MEFWKFGQSWQFWKLIRWILFCFDTETMHLLSLKIIRLCGVLRRVRGRVKQIEIHGSAHALKNPHQCVTFLGLPCLSAVGLAAGFDKNAEILEGLATCGFGFVEIGTVTPRSQEGNERPRLFRDVATSSLFNRMGFNGYGAAQVARNLGEARSRLPLHFRVGVNLGKNKDTSLQDAASDYVEAIRYFEGLADYFVVNVSSPNTPGLRSLQSIENLRPILLSVQDCIAGWKLSPPLLLKLAPDLNNEELAALIQAAEGFGVNGWVLTNTLAGTFETAHARVSGGWSGQRICHLARDSLRAARQVTQKPVISVGGILSCEEAQLRLSMGADGIQIYTGWIYGGPFFPRALTRALRRQKP
jgi:dihydroorotate dehydrogenase